MTRKKLWVTLFGLVLSLAFVGCETTNTNGNSNVAVVTNTNTANANTANANRPLNANVTREEYEKDRGYYEQEARRLGRKVGQGANDLWIWTKTRAVLGATDELRDTTIDVDVENEVVTLSGNVPNAAQKTKAEQVAKSIEGVKSVVNNLNVSNTK